MFTIPETKQEIFDKVVAGLASQGFMQSMSDELEEKYCAYRGAENRKCAAGWLIPDEFYLKRWDYMGGVTWRSLASEGCVPAIETAFIDMLQTAHDNGDTPEQMKNQLKQVAKNYNLNVPESLL